MSINDDIGNGMGFDAILDQVNPFGPYQWRTWFIGGVFEVPMAFYIMFFVFGGANPGWECRQNETETNIGFANGTRLLYINESLVGGSSCDVNKSQCLSRIYNTDFTSVVTEWDLVCERQYIPTIITTCLMAGVALGAAVMGQLADTYGRRHVFIIGGTLAMLGEAAQALAPTWQVFALVRFFIGFFAGGSLVMVYVIPLEVVGRQYRTLCATVDGWCYGCLILAFLAYFVRDWRHLSLVTGLIGLPLSLLWFCLTESPRWLIQHKRIEQAAKIINYIAKVNRRPPPDLSDLELICKQEGDAELRKRNYNFLSIFQSRKLTRHTFVMVFLWIQSSMSFYGILINMRDVSGNLYLDLVISTIIDLVFKMSIIGTTKWFGRRRSVFAYLCLVSACFLTIIICDLCGTLDELPRLRLAVAMVGRGGITASWGIAMVHSVEVFPTVVRNIAFSACSIGARIGGVIAPLVAYLHFYHRSFPYVVFAIMSVVCTLLVLLLPETRDKPLPDALPDDGPCCDFRPCRRGNKKYGETSQQGLESKESVC